MLTLFDLLESHKNNPKDKRVFGLVVQGGGMMAAYSSGAILPLIEYGFSDTFDHVVGSSAGGINGAYFIDKHTETMQAYMHDLASKDFVNLLRREKKVDVDFAVDVVLKQRYPISAANLDKAKTKLHVVLTDAKTGKKVVISDHHKFVKIYEEFRATAALPVLYDKPVLLQGSYYVDGAVADSLPIDVAFKLGCTDIVVIMNQQIKSYQFDRRHDRLVKHLIKRFAKNSTTAVRHKLPTDERLLRVNLRRLTQPHKKLRLYVLEPSDEEAVVSLGTIDKPKIKKLARLGVTDMDMFLSKPILP